MNKKQWRPCLAKHGFLQKIWGVFGILFLLQICYTPLSAFASEVADENDVQIVRVGVFDSPAYYGVSSDGELSGYGYDYLKELEAVSQLRFEFVQGTREEHVANLQAGEIDLLDTISRSAIFEQQFLYSEFPTVLSSGTLNVLSSNESYVPEDYLSFEGMRVGLLENGTRTPAFSLWAQEQGFTYTDYYYTDGALLFNALLHGEIDALVSDDIYYDVSQTVVARFEPELYYFITTKDNVQLMAMVDEAMAVLTEEKPSLRVELGEKYMGILSNSNTLTSEELRYIETNFATPIRVLYDANNAPFEYFDDESQSASGLSVDVFERLMETVDLTYEYIPTESQEEAVSILQAGGADIMLSHDVSLQESAEEEFAHSISYLNMPVAIVGKEDYLTGDAVFALREDVSEAVLNYLKQYFPDNELRYYPSSEACYEAVGNGNGVFTVDNIFEASHASSGGAYGDLVILSTSLNENNSLLYSPLSNELMRSILDKNIRAQGGQLSEGILLSHISALNEQDEISQWWELYGAYVLGISALVLLLVVLSLSYLLQRQKKLRKELWETAYLDPLTKLPNMRCLKKEAEKLLVKNKDKQYLAVQVDFNQFSLLNDIYGQAEGNHILSLMAQALSTVVKPESDIVARLRADNFLLLYAHDPTMGVDDLHERDAGQVFDFMGRNVNHHLSYCIGRYQVPLGETDVNDICEKVNYAHRQAKKELSGVAVVDYEETTKQKALRHRYLEEKMEEALENEEFLVYLQPKYSLKLGTVVGAESLVRWKDGKTGELISPAEFIPLFEQNGFVKKLDFYMFEKICKILQERLQKKLPIVPISVNFSRLHLQTPNLVDRITEIANKYEVPRQYLEIELVESTVVDNEELLENMLKELQEVGFTLSIDDFGTGYSSLGLLKNLPVDVIKIDRSFFANNRSKIRAKTVISNVIRMAKELNISTVAEGVETQEHVNFLRGIGCDSVQGFYFSRPISVFEFNWGEGKPISMPTSRSDYQTLSLADLGDVSLGRANLGEMMPVMVHRQLEYSIRETLERRYGERETVEIMRESGKLAGILYAEGYLDLEAPFDAFMKQLKLSLYEQQIGDMGLEEYNDETGQITVVMVDDLTCSGVSDTRRTLCHYEEGFLAGILQKYQKKPYTVRETDCWGNGAELCRFKGRPNQDPTIDATAMTESETKPEEISS